MTHVLCKEDVLYPQAWGTRWMTRRVWEGGGRAEPCGWMDGDVVATQGNLGVEVSLRICVVRRGGDPVSFPVHLLLCRAPILHPLNELSRDPRSLCYYSHLL